VFDSIKTSWAQLSKNRAAKREQRSAQRAASQEQAEYQQALNRWNIEVEHAASAVALVSSLQPGETSSGLMVGADESVIGWISGASLIEIRSSGGHYEGGSSGFSIPVGSVGGRSVRYRVGRSSGHYVAGTPSPQAVDVGTFYVTDRRLVFVGRKGTRECLLSKTVSMDRSRAGEIIIGVSNRQKNTEVAYGKQHDDVMSFWLDTALARFHGKGDEFLENLRHALADVQSEKPIEPKPILPPAAN